MQRIFLPVSILVVAIHLCVASPTLGRASSLSSQSPSNVEQELIRLEHLLIESLIKKDFETYAQYLSDDYTEIRTQGGLFTKNQVVQMGKRSGGKMERYDLTDLKVRVYGEIAIVTGRYARKGTNMSLSGQPFEFDEQGRFTDIWVKQQGRWRCVNNQDTAIATPPTATRSQTTPAAATTSVFPVGTYAAKSPQGTWVLEFKRDGTMTVKLDEFSLGPDITYIVKNDQIEISGGTASAMCEGKGTYKWTFEGQALAFQIVSDPNCQPRQAVLTGAKFTKQP